MATSSRDLIPHLFGRDVNDEGGQEDPAEFIENSNFAIDGQAYADAKSKAHSYTGYISVTPT